MKYIGIKDALVVSVNFWFVVFGLLRVIYI
jgi:hypothetical protein